MQLAKYLRKELNVILDSFMSYMISCDLSIPSLTGGIEFIKSMRDLKLEGLDGYLFATYDFKDLYTNITNDSVKNILENVCRILNIPSEKCEFLLNLYRLYNLYNYFQVGKKIYKQQEGLSMGCYFSVEISDIVLLYSEYLFLLCSDEDELMLLKRYIDDGFLALSIERIDAALKTLEVLISFYPSNLEITFSLNTKGFEFWIKVILLIII